MITRSASRHRAFAVLCLAMAAVRAVAAPPPLQALAQHVGAGQPVYAEADDGTVLVAQDEGHAVHPASVSKVATTLALLRRLGPDHRFETRLVATGPVRGDTIAGNLRLVGGGDPYMVFEGLDQMLARVAARGIRRVSGALEVQGPFILNWQPDPDGKRAAAVLQGRDGEAAWRTIAASSGFRGPRTLAEAALRFDHQAPSADGDQPETLVVHRSPPLLHVVKVLNGFSNNVFHLAADRIGGTATVDAIAKESVPAAIRDEIRIDNGAGAGTTNRLSPRAATALLRALEHEAAVSGHGLPDVLPVSGFDPGTLEDRFLDHRGVVVGKTGTYGDVGASALAGVLTTRRYGTVRFAVLNTFVPVPEARHRQDAFVRALIEATDAQPWNYTRAVEPGYSRAEVR